MAKVRITQVKSTIKKSRRQKATMAALGLKRINHSVEKEVNPQIQGMINKVAHIVRVEEI